MTCVSEQTPRELRAHVRKLQGMPGWHDPLVDRLHKEVIEQHAEIKRLREALDSIRQCGADTLSGRIDGGPDDRAWQRDAVREMTKRARAALQGGSKC